MGLSSLPWEARLPVAALAHGGGRVYRKGQTDDGTTDCSREVFATLAALYGYNLVKPERPALMLWDAQWPWSPPEACERLGIGTLVPAPHPGQWHLVQGWVSTTPLAGGHSFFFWQPPAPFASGTGVVVQANKGVGAFVETDKTFAMRVARYTEGNRIAVLQEP